MKKTIKSVANMKTTINSKKRKREGKQTINSKKRKREEEKKGEDIISTREEKKGEDMISRLPVPILHHVLSFLPTNDATKTGALSKSWNTTWKSFPFLDFDQYAFYGALSKKSRKKSCVKRFCQHVQSSIDTRPHKDDTIQKFRASVNFQAFRQADAEYLDVWLDFAVTNNVRDLVLEYFTKPHNPKEWWRYVLPLTLFRACSSLQSLDLFGCQFVENNNINMLGLSNLKKLSLVHVYIHQHTLQGLLTRCRHLEELTIQHSQGFESVRVSNSPRLKAVDLYLSRGPDKVQVVSVSSAPNLRSVSYGGGIDSVQGSVLGSDYYGSVEELKFHDTDVTDDFFRSVIPRFRKIRKLELEMCFMEESVRISSDRLSELVMRESYMVKRIELDARCLTRFSVDSSANFVVDFLR